MGVDADRRDATEDEKEEKRLESVEKICDSMAEQSHRSPAGLLTMNVSAVVLMARERGKRKVDAEAVCMTLREYIEIKVAAQQAQQETQYA